MTENPIVDEARRAGESLFAKHGNDMHAVVEYLRRRSITAGRTPTSLPAKPARILPSMMETKKKVG